MGDRSHAITKHIVPIFLINLPFNRTGRQKDAKRFHSVCHFFVYILYFDISSHSTKGYTGVLWKIKTWTYHLQPNNILQLFDCIYYLWSNWELIDSDWEGDTYAYHLQELIRHIIMFILIILPEEMIVSLGENGEVEGGKNVQLVLLLYDLGFLWLSALPKPECDWTLVFESGSCLCAVWCT